MLFSWFLTGPSCKPWENRAGWNPCCLSGTKVQSWMLPCPMNVWWLIPMFEAEMSLDDRLKTDWKLNQYNPGGWTTKLSLAQRGKELFPLPQWSEWLSRDLTCPAKPMFSGLMLRLSVQNKELCAVVLVEVCLAQHSVTPLSKEGMSHFICENPQNFHCERSTRVEQTALDDTPQKVLPGFGWPEPSGALHIRTWAAQSATCSINKIPRLWHSGNDL